MHGRDVPARHLRRTPAGEIQDDLVRVDPELVKDEV
jgi:hypothetical protein